MKFVKNVMMNYLNGRNQKNKLDKNSKILFLKLKFDNKLIKIEERFEL